MSNSKKVTKAEMFAELREILIDLGAEAVDEELKGELIDFIDAQVAMLDKRKEAAAARNAKKKEASDELTEKIFAVITEDLKSVDEILGELDGEDITRNKVIARLGKLVREERIVKEFVKVDGHKRTAYALPAAADESDEAEGDAE